MRFSTVGFFHQTIPPWPLIQRLKPLFKFCFEFAEIGSIFEGKNRVCSINDTARTEISIFWVG
jgi:hypothetical protein